MANTRVYIVPDSTGTQRSAYPSGNWQQVNAPSGLTATVDGYTAVLQWADTNGGVASYVVQGSASASSGFSDAATTSTGATSATMSGLSVGAHYFRVFGQIGSVRSASPTSVVSVTVEAPASAGSQRVIYGSGFGVGPTVELYAPLIGSHGAALTVSSTSIGSFFSLAGASPQDMSETPRFWVEDGRSWMTGRDSANLSVNEKNGCSLRWRPASNISEFRVSWRIRIANGYRCVDASAPNSMEGVTNSCWKQLWLGNPGIDNDLCIGTFNSASGYQNQGNAVTPLRAGGSRISFSRSYFRAGVNQDNLMSYYQSGAPGVVGGYTETIDLLQWGGGFLRNVATDVDTFHPTQSTLPTYRDYSQIAFNGWMGNSSDGYSDVLPLWADLYVATGANSRACIITHDAPTLAASSANNTHIIPPDSWSNTTIVYTPEAWCGAYNSLFLSDGTLIENVGFS